MSNINFCGISISPLNWEGSKPQVFIEADCLGRIIADVRGVAIATFFLLAASLTNSFILYGITAFVIYHSCTRYNEGASGWVASRVHKTASTLSHSANEAVNDAKSWLNSWRGLDNRSQLND